MNKKLETARNLYLEGIRDGKAREAVTKYTGERYTQHSKGVRDGVEGFVEFFEPFIERNPIRDITINRGLVDGQYVFVHAYQSLNNGEAEWITTDFFDTNEEDKIIEHWDVIGGYTAKTPSGHTSYDGATEITDLHYTQQNKNIVRRFLEAVWMGGSGDKISDYVSAEAYVEHSADLADGIEAYKAFFETGRLTYKDMVLMVGEGNYTANLSTAYLYGKEITKVDIYSLKIGMNLIH